MIMPTSAIKGANISVETDVNIDVQHKVRNGRKKMRISNQFNYVA